MPDIESIIDAGLKRFEYGIKEDQDERDRAAEDLRFIWDDDAQWDSEVRRLRESQDPPRPCITIDKISEKVDRVEGEFLQMEPSFKVRAVDSNGDPVIADIAAGMLRHIEAVSGARDVYNASHTSVLTCGRGAWRIDVVDCEEDCFLRELRINPIPNVFSVVVDPACVKKDKSDANWAFVTTTYSEEDFKSKFGEDNWVDFPQGDTWVDWRTDKGRRVAEYWWREWGNVTYYRVNRLGKEFTVTEKMEFDEILDKKTIKEPKVKWCELTAQKIIDDKVHDWPGKYIPIIYESGKAANLFGENRSRGMVRKAKEPARLYNYWTSSATESVALSPKAPYLATANMISRHQKQWDEASWKNFMYLLYDADPDNPQIAPTRQPPPQVSPGIANELVRLEHDISSSMGIYAPSLGDASNERSGRAIYARQSQGSIGSYAYTKGFHSALQHSCRVQIDLIPYVYDTERVVRIIGEDEQELQVPINAAEMPQEGGNGIPKQYLSPARQGITDYLNDMTVGKYDIVVTIGPSYSSLREEALAQLTELGKTNPQLAMLTTYMMVENLDMPKANKLKTLMQKMGMDPTQPPPPPPPNPEIELKMQELQLKQEDQKRKEFDSLVNAITGIMTAEAKQIGEQFSQSMTEMQQILQFIQAGQQQQQMAQDQQMQMQQMSHEKELAAQQAQVPQGEQV